MGSIIDNRKKTMLDSLRNSLKQAERVDILTAFFYFSGFNALADELKDKKIRILVGNTIDPDAIAELCNANYVHSKLIEDNFRALLYTGTATKSERTVVKQNFDASCNIEDQKDDYDIIVATDALSEGFNLNTLTY